MDRDRLDAFGYLVSSSIKSVTKIKSKGMSRYGLGSTHTVCLRKLYSESEALTRSQLAELCSIDKSQVTRVVGELVKKGYVTESEEERCSRKTIKLSEKGKAVVEEINEVVDSALDFVSGDIGEERLAEFYETFAQITEKLKQAEALDWNTKNNEN